MLTSCDYRVKAIRIQLNVSRILTKKDSWSYGFEQILYSSTKQKKRRPTGLRSRNRCARSLYRRSAASSVLMFTGLIASLCHVSLRRADLSRYRKGHIANIILLSNINISIHDLCLRGKGLSYSFNNIERF